MWIDNGDGSYTAQEKDTLWGLGQITGKDWRDSNYKGKPENLQIGQRVSFKSNAEKLDTFASVVGDMTGAISEGCKAFGKEWHLTSSTPNQFQYPLKTLADPDLMRASQQYSDIGKGLLALGIGLDVYDGIYTGIKTGSFWHGAYRTVANLASTAAGYYAGAAVTGVLTAGTFGTGAIPGIILGTGVGVATSKGVSWLFEQGEKAIWK